MTMLHLPMASWNDGGARHRPDRRAHGDGTEDVAAAMGASPSSWPALAPAPASAAAGGACTENGHGDDAKGAEEDPSSSSLPLAHVARTGGNADTRLVGTGCGMVDAWLAIAMRAALAWMTMMGLPTMALK